jgi:hypothetical protein
MREHRNPRKRLPKPQPPDNEIDGLLYILRDNLRRADAFISTAEHQIEESWHDDDEEDENQDDEHSDNGILRHRMRVEYLVEGSKYAVRAALYTTQQIDAAIAARKRGA